MDQPLDTAALFVANDFFKAHPELGAALRGELTMRIETALRAVVREERESCAVQCDSRRGRSGKGPRRNRARRLTRVPRLGRARTKPRTWGSGPRRVKRSGKVTRSGVQP